MPPKEWFDVARPSVESAAIPVAENRDYALSLLVPAKTSPRDYLDRHEYAAVHPVRVPRNKSGKAQSAEQSASIDYTPFKPFAVAFDWLMPDLATQRLELARQLAPSVTRPSRACGFDCLDAPALDFTIQTFQSRFSPFSNRSAWLPPKRETASEIISLAVSNYGIILSYSACESIQNHKTPPSISKPNAR